MKRHCTVRTLLLYRRGWSWNQKNLDYEIETHQKQKHQHHPNPWNQKNLDYEIETERPTRRRRPPLRLEIKRTSITRLKLKLLRRCPNWTLFLEIKRTSITRLKHFLVAHYSEKIYSWNQKNLDYEIETQSQVASRDRCQHLKSKEPRLRDWNHCEPLGSLTGDFPWNQKNLDYEIETKSVTGILRGKFFHLEIKRTSITRLKLPNVKRRDSRLSTTWNQKNLDYEIETWVPPVALIDDSSLKSKEPRLRDWNSITYSMQVVQISWNQKNLDYEIETYWCSVSDDKAINLEIKRTSITRLKLKTTTSITKKRSLEIKRTSITRLKHTSNDTWDDF